MNKEEVKKYLDRLNLIFYGIIAVPLVAFAYVYLENKVGRIEPQIVDEVASILQYVIPTMIIVVSGTGIIIPGSQIRRIDGEGELKDRLAEFQRSLILRYAHFEAASIIAVIAFYLTTDLLYAVLFIGTLILFSLNRPTPYRVISNLNLKGEERELFSHTL